MGIQIRPREGAILAACPKTLCDELCKNGWTDREFGFWTRVGRMKWRRCGLMSNYF